MIELSSYKASVNSKIDLMYSGEPTTLKKGGVDVVSKESDEKPIGSNLSQRWNLMGTSNNRKEQVVAMEKGK